MYKKMRKMTRKCYNRDGKSYAQEERNLSGLCRGKPRAQLGEDVEGEALEELGLRAEALSNMLANAGDLLLQGKLLPDEFPDLTVHGREFCGELAEGSGEVLSALLEGGSEVNPQFLGLGGEFPGLALGLIEAAGDGEALSALLDLDGNVGREFLEFFDITVALLEFLDAAGDGGSLGRGNGGNLLSLLSSTSNESVLLADLLQLLGGADLGLFADDLGDVEGTLVLELSARLVDLSGDASLDVIDDELRSQIEVLSDSDGRDLDPLFEDDLGLLGQFEPALLSVLDDFLRWGLEEEGVLLLGDVDLCMDKGIESSDPGAQPFAGEDVEEGSAFTGLGSEAGSPFAGLLGELADALGDGGEFDFGPLLKEEVGLLAALLKEELDDGDGGETFVDVELESRGDFGGHGV